MKILFFTLLSITLSQVSFATESLKCHGTEPFWDADVSSKRILFGLLDEKKSLTRVSKVSAAAGMAEEFLQVYSDRYGNAAAIVKTAECNNGMSDHIFPKEVIILGKNATYYGCCGEGVLPPEQN